MQKPHIGNGLPRPTRRDSEEAGELALERAKSLSLKASRLGQHAQSLFPVSRLDFYGSQPFIQRIPYFRHLSLRNGSS